MTPIFIASDHRGFESKQNLLASVALPAGFQFVDLGPSSFNPDDDYNDAAVNVADHVKSTPGSFGVLICGSAHGISIQANRFKGIRAIVGLTPELAKISREHNNANVLCLSADFQDSAAQTAALLTFLETPFSGEDRHIRRNQRLDEEGI